MNSSNFAKNSGKTSSESYQIIYFILNFDLVWISEIQ